MAMTPDLLIGGAGMTVGSAGLTLAAWRRHRPTPSTAPATRTSLGVVPAVDALGGTMMPPGREPFPARRIPWSMAAAAFVATGTAVLTRWPAAAILAGAGAAGMPALLRSTRRGNTTAHLEAIAAWTELLRDTMAAAAGLGQAIVATAELAPVAIRPFVATLAERLASGVPMEDALRAFADDLADPSADLVVCALLIAATAKAQRLGELLGALADSCREEIAMRLRVEASRASSRSSVRTVIVFSLAFAAVLFVLAHAYLVPFGSATGQLVLLAVGSCYAAGLILMVRLIRPRPGVRLLDGGSGR